MTEQTKQKRSPWLTIAIAAGALVVLCMCVVAAGGAAAYIFREDILAFGLRQTAQSPIEPYGDLPAAPPASQMPPNGSLEEQFATIEEIMIGVRGLELEEPVPRDFLTNAELADVVENDLFAEYPPEDAADDAAVLAAFDVVPYGFDLLGLYTNLYSQGIAGFYDPEERAFYIVSEDDNLDAEEEITYAHELVHVLQDQNFDLNTFMNYDDEDFFLANADEAYARQAVVEGDASISERLYEQYYMLGARVDEYYLAQLEYDLSFFATVPDFIIAGFIFPYDEGATFVQAVYEQGGFDAVNDLYTDPPTSTEHILHPERFFNGDDPLPVEIIDPQEVLGEPYREVYISQMGEFGVREYLAQSLTRADASAAAAGWGGDRYGAYINDDTGRVVLTFRIVWDDAAEADEFSTLFADYQQAWHTPETELTGPCATQGDEVLCLFRLDEVDTIIIRAPDVATAEDLAALYE